MKEKLEQIKKKIEQIEAEISDLEQSKTVLELYRFEIENPDLKKLDWSEEAENILNHSCNP